MAKYSCWTEMLSLPAVALIQGSFLETTEEVVIDTCFWLLLNTNTAIWEKNSNRSLQRGLLLGLVVKCIYS